MSYDEEHATQIKIFQPTKSKF